MTVYSDPAWDDVMAERDRLRLALEEIVSPLHFMQERAALKGDKLDGHMAYQIANSVSHLQSIAKAALTTQSK